MFDKEKGVSLIELLITVTVMSILLAVSFWGYKDRGRELAFERAVFNFTTKLEQVREMAMSAQEVGTERPEGGYGVHFTIGNSYIIFVDSFADKVYTAADTVVDTVSLEEGTGISALSDTPLDIVFEPPSPSVYINGALGTAEITLSGAGRSRKIIINSAGLISTE